MPNTLSDSPSKTFKISKMVVTLAKKNAQQAQQPTGQRPAAQQAREPSQDRSNAQSAAKTKAGTKQQDNAEKKDVKKDVKNSLQASLAKPTVGKAAAKSTNKASVERVLTLAEINAMPDADYMSAPQLRYFKSVLDGMRADILINSDATSEHLRENVVVPDPADRATIEEEHAIELRTRDRERKLLKKIAQALEAIEQGEYGWCEETGDAIGLRRLIARPTATLSLEAQQRRELKQKMYGD